MSIPYMVGSTLYNAISGLVYRAEGIPYLQHVVIALVRAKFGTADYSKPTTAPSSVQLYRKYAKAKGYEPNVVKLETGGNALWFGSPKAKNILFYIPGGGYVWPMADGQVLFLHSLQKAIKDDGGDFAIFCFSYDLVPEAKHPTQLKQAVAAFHYLLQTTGLQPNDIILGGDSAGANLSLMLLSHAAHGYPGVEAVKMNGHSFRATVLLCPWVSMTNEGPNLERNKDIDYISEFFLGPAQKLWLSESQDDGYTSPLKNDASWWKDVPSGDLFVAGGEYEYFVDDIDGIVEKLQVHKKVDYTRAKHEVHDHFAVAATTGDPPPESDRALRSYIKSKL